MRTLLVAAAVAPLALTACGAPADGADAAQAAARGDITIDDPAAYPESITSMSDGTVIIGGSQGKVFRAGPGETVAATWIESSPENGMQGVLGVLADEASNTLWLCSIPAMFGGGAGGGTNGLMAFDLASGAPKGAYPFPPNAEGAPGVCNDIAVAADGAVYATDTPGGRILMLPQGADALELHAEDARLAGVDGIAFAEDGTMYVNNVQTHELIRVAGAGGGGGGAATTALTVLAPSLPLDGPDGMRPLGGNRFVQAEGNAGRISIIAVEGDTATITPIREGLMSSPGVAVVGDTAYAIEGKINYLMDPNLRGQDPGPFIAHAIPLNPQD